MFYQMCRAVAHMHKQNPPVIHRDLKVGSDKEICQVLETLKNSSVGHVKCPSWNERCPWQIFLNHFIQDHSVLISFQVENLLFGNKGQIKLCDFGSATVKAVVPDDSWTALQRSLAEDEVNPTSWSQLKIMKVVSYTDPPRFLIHYVSIRLWNWSYDELQHCVTAAFEIKLSNFFTVFNFLLLLFSFQIQRNTTPMYRAPEMVDLYSNMPVTEKADIWVSLLRYIIVFWGS